MENRALIAFGLSLAVFIVWGIIMSKVDPPPEMTSTNAPVSETAQAPTASPGNEASSAPSAPAASGANAPASAETSQANAAPIVEPAEETLVSVYNGDMTYIFSSLGGVLKEVRAEKYKDDEGVPLNLVPHNNAAQYPLALQTGDAQVDRVLQQSHFTPTATSINLDASNKTGSLAFKLEHPSGLKIERRYSFEFENKLISAETRVDAPQWAQKNLTYTVLWGPGLGGEIKSQSDYISFSGPTTFVNNERVETSPDDIKGRITHKGDLEWTSFQNKYFAAALVPEEGIKSAFVKKENGDDLYVGLDLESVQSSASAKFLVFIGTKELQLLESSGHKLVRLIDYGWLGNKFAFLVKPMLKALNFFYGLTGNYGWAIIFLTFLIKLFLFPLTHKSFKSMKGMQKVQPYVKVIQERNKDDRQKMNQEMMDLYRKHKVNPLGGCLPMILQIPVFISLYHALFFSIELRGAPFMLWIHDLSQSDPYYVTPVLMGVTMFLQQKMTPSTVVDPIQQKIFLMMPIVFTFLFITFPAGLVIYWTVNNVLTIAQQYYIYHVAKD